MKLKYYILSLLIYSSSTLDAQRETLLENLSQFRTETLLKETENLKDFAALINNWMEIEPSEEQLGQIVFNLQYALLVEKIKPKKVIELAEAHIDNTDFVDALTIDDLEIISKNPLLLNLISGNVLDGEFPFKITAEELIQEIEFYNFLENDVVAEIGVGQGTFVVLMSMLGLDLKIYYNEIDKKLLKYIKDIILVDIPNKYDLIPIKGSKKKIKIKQALDKVIVRHSLHHFSHKSQMLKSIYDKLKPNGELLIMESKWTEENANYCALLMHESEMIESIEQNNFTIVDKLEIEDVIILKCKKILVQ